MNKESKKFILIIFKYFPYGGAQRDLLQLAKKLCKKNFVEIVCMDWDGTYPNEKNISVKIIKSKYCFNYKRYSEFKNMVSQYIEYQTNVISISFSKISGFDFYYAADSCFASKNKNFFKNLSPRYQFFHQEEYQIFNPKSKQSYYPYLKKKTQFINLFTKLLIVNLSLYLLILIKSFLLTQKVSIPQLIDILKKITNYLSLLAPDLKPKAWIVQLLLLQTYQ